MRKLVLALSVLLLLITPALAREPEEAAMPDFGEKPEMGMQIAQKMMNMIGTELLARN